ncbi:MAG: serine protease [Proteobacteria bacterium]|nr:serine protease [Pseudomonadota bacterium]
MKKILLIALLALFSFNAPLLAKQEIEDSVVKIFAAKQSHNYNEPWKSNSIHRSYATGFIIDNNRVLTNAHAVSNARYIQVRFGNDPRKKDVEVEYISDDYDLAILKFSDTSDIPKIKPLKFSDSLKLKEKVVVYGYPMGGDKLSITEGIISRIQLHTYAFSQKKYTTMQTDAAINPGNSGGPVLLDGKVIGVAFQGISRANNIGYMIPAHIVKHFLEDVKDKKYDGIPTLGIKWMPLESSIHRNMLGMKDKETGVLIKKISPFAKINKVLKKNDVILSIENFDIGIDGSIQFNSNARIGFSSILEYKKFGDNIKIKFLREGERQSATFKLQKPDKKAVVDVYKSDTPPSYFITSGFIFEKLSINYINQYNAALRNRAYTPYDLIKLIDDYPKGIDEIVFIVTVLPDESNEGYQNLRNIAIKQINGEKIINFQDFIQKIKAKRYAVLTDFKDNSFVIDNELSEKRDAKIKGVYNISSLFSKDLKLSASNNAQ